MNRPVFHLDAFARGVRVFGLTLAVAVALTLPGLSFSQSVRATNAPLPFTIVSPSTWVRGPIITGDTRIAFKSPKDTPRAECTVSAVEFKGQSLSQQDINQHMANLPTVGDAESTFGVTYNNVKVRSIGRGILAGLPAHVVVFSYSVGTPNGEAWGVVTSTTASVTPNTTWAVGCAGLGTTLVDAQKAFSFWQSELNRFPSNFKFD